MRYTIIWNKLATDGLDRLRRRDGSGVKPLLKAINALASNPEPACSTKVGRTERRLKVGKYRALYEIDGNTIAVKILMVGSTSA